MSSDWFAVAIHYAALHLINAFLIQEGVEKQRREPHAELHRTLKTATRYQHIWKSYRPLVDASHSARYTPSEADVITVPDAERLGHHYLVQVESSILKLAGWIDKPAKLAIERK